MWILPDHQGTRYDRLRQFGSGTARPISFESPPSPSDDHFDIISAIFAIKRRLPVQLSYRHVEGYQREKYPGRPLDSWALLNDDMDTLVKTYWLLCHRNDTPKRQSICHEEWAVWIGQENLQELQAGDMG
jgi:hypothetical protein